MPTATRTTKFRNRINTTCAVGLRLHTTDVGDFYHTHVLYAKQTRKMQTKMGQYPAFSFRGCWDTLALAALVQVSLLQSGRPKGLLFLSCVYNDNLPSEICLATSTSNSVYYHHCLRSVSLCEFRASWFAYMLYRHLTRKSTDRIWIW
jgi:hypothetical protein